MLKILQDLIASIRACEDAGLVHQYAEGENIPEPVQAYHKAFNEAEDYLEKATATNDDLGS